MVDCGEVTPRAGEAATTVGEDGRRRDGRRSAAIGEGDGRWAAPRVKGDLFIYFKGKDFLSLGPRLNLTAQIKHPVFSH